MSVTLLSLAFLSPQPASVYICPSSPYPSKSIDSTLPSSWPPKTMKPRKLLHSPVQTLRSHVSSFTYVSHLQISCSLQTQLLNSRLRQFGKKRSVFFSRILPLRRRYGQACIRCSPVGDGDKQQISAEGEDSLRKDGDGGDWTTSVLLFVFWAGIMYYVFQLAPDQTPSQDFYFLQKLLNLKGDDGFRMNQVLVSLWYIMGLWPLAYSMLLIPSARSSRSRVAVWPFALLSFFGGAYALIPYFVLWKPPFPPVDEAELKKWPLSFLESKITAAVVAVAGLCLVAYAVMSPGDDWREFYRYFRESKFIHVMSLDFSLLTAFSPFWIYNDMTARRWYDRGSWLLPLSLVPLLGPLLYLVLRPSLSSPAASLSSPAMATRSTTEDK